MVDNEAKLKNTLSHEICHIAAWAIDKEMKPAHGPAFKAWGRKIMKARKDISVTTKHSYEIGRPNQSSGVLDVFADLLASRQLTSFNGCARAPLAPKSTAGIRNLLIP